MRFSRRAWVRATLLQVLLGGGIATDAAAVPDASVTGTILFNLGTRQDLET